MRSTSHQDVAAETLGHESSWVSMGLSFPGGDLIDFSFYDAAPICIGVHGVFAVDAYESLKTAGAADVVTCNTVSHPSHAIDLTDALAERICTLLTKNVEPIKVTENT